MSVDKEACTRHVPSLVGFMSYPTQIVQLKLVG
jgi:hypothetical protein